MSKFIIVGHKSIEISSVFKTMKIFGIEEPNISNAYKKDIFEIESILNELNVKKHGKNIPKIWDGLALDLLLSNFEKKLWGWCNPESIHNLEFWKNIDQDFSFILIYDKPEKALLSAINNFDIDNVLNDWCAYNQKILSFYLENQERCLLINYDQFSSMQYEGIKFISDNIQRLDVTVNYDTSVLEQNKKLIINENISNVNLAEQNLTSYLATNILTEFTYIKELYEKLQAVADLPLEEKKIQNISAVAAWRALESLKENYLIENQKIVFKLEEIIDVEKQNNLNKQNELNNTLSETQMILEQLHNAQEELEVVFNKQNEMQKLLRVEQERSESISTEKIQLIEEQKKLIDSKSVAEKENQELLQQLHLVQEELETFYLQTIKNNAIEEDEGLYGAADRIKAQLSYRLGATMIMKSKSITGCLFMPFSLISTYRNYKKEIKNREKLPAISTYKDAYDVQRVQNHLSYQLGNYFIKNIKKPWMWIFMPIGMVKIVRNFRAQKN